MRKIVPLLFLACVACGDEESDESSDKSPATNDDAGVDGGGTRSDGGGGAGGGAAEGGAGGGGSGVDELTVLQPEPLPGAFVCDPATALRDLGASDGDVTRLLPVDVNKDGKDDLFMGSHGDGGSSNILSGYGVHLLLSGSKGWELSTDLGMPCGGTASECGLDMVVEDHDKDGHLDVLSVSPTWSKLMIFTGNGKGTFSQLGDDLRIEDNPGDYRFWDVDKDGDSDLVSEMAQGCEEKQEVVSAADYCVGDSQCTGDLVCRHSFLGGGSDLCLPKPCAGFQVLENQGVGMFKLGTLQTVAMDDVGTPHAGDVNGDGLLDAFVATPDLAWFVNTGTGYQQAPATRLNGFNYRKAFDIDKDGRDELIVDNYVLWADANGKFTRMTQHSFQEDPKRITAFRIDDQRTLVASGGALKMGTSKQWSVSVSVFEGGTLKKHFDLCTPPANDVKGTVAAADVDGDGKRELVVGGIKKDMLQVYDGAFTY